MHRPLTLVASEHVIWLLDSSIEVARHARSCDRVHRIEDDAQPSLFGGECVRRFWARRRQHRVLEGCPRPLSVQEKALIAIHLSPTLSQMPLSHRRKAFILVAAPLGVRVVLLLLHRSAITGSALAMAAALLIRPAALFAALGCLVVLLRRRDGRRTAWWLALCAIGPALTILLNLHYYGHWNHQAWLYSTTPNVEPEILAALLRFQPPRAYFNVPFVSLVMTPLIAPVPIWKIVFIYVHVLILLAVLPILAWRSRLGDSHLVWAVWGLLNAAFIVCLGPYWGFHTFDRYCVWALPAYATAFTAPSSPLFHRSRRLAVVLALSTASSIMALWGMIK